MQRKLLLLVALSFTMIFLAPSARAQENATIASYRERVRQCEALGEFAMAEQIRQILVDEQDHQIDLATALGEDVPDVGRGPIRKRG